MVRAARATEASALSMLLVFTTVFSSLPLRGYAVSSQVSSAGPCFTQVSAMYDSLDREAAIQWAETSPLYDEVVTSTTNLQFYSIFETSVSIPPDCEVSNLKINVVFGGDNGFGFAYYVISEDPTTLAPISLQIQQNPIRNEWGCTGNSCNSGNWAGYEVYGNVGHTANVWDANFQYNQSSAGFPSTGCGTIGFCLVSTWTGLEDRRGAGDNVLAQDGTQGLCTGQGCTPSYAAWYEMLPAPEITCTGVTINRGDMVYAEVLNGYAIGGSKTQYTFNVHDATNGQGCITTATYTSLSNPTIGTFITENPMSCNIGFTSCAPLAKFGDIRTVYSEIKVGQVYNMIGYYVSLGYYWKDTMQNAPGIAPQCGAFVTNVSPGSVNGGTFNMKWYTSANTPPYITGC